MTTAQKIIKYLAIALAVFLIINIVSAVLYGLYGIATILGLTNDTNEIATGETTQVDENRVEILEIDVLYTNLKIRVGEEFKVDADEDYIYCEQDGEKMKIDEEERGWFSKNDRGDMTIYIPEDFKFEKIEINTGAGKIDIDKLTTEEIYLEVGAGKAEIDNLNVSEKAEIEGGAGEIKITSGSINDLDLDMGIGKVTIESKLLGETKINAGIGDLDINIDNNKENYRIKANKGIGSIKIDDIEAKNDKVYGEGENYIKVDGGIGSIKIRFNEGEENESI